MPRRNLAWLIGIVLTSLVGLAVAYSAPSRDKDYELVRLFVDVLSQVDHKYVRALDQEAKRKLVEDMINGGLERLDPHSEFKNAKRYKEFEKETKGKFGGVGILLNRDPRTNVLTVASPLVGTPAYEAGVLAGDRIIKIDGKSTESMHQNEAVDLIQGNPGEKITITVLHEDSTQPVDLQMIRAEIHVPSVMGDIRKADNPMEWDYFVDSQNKIAYVRLTTFGEKTAKELQRIVEELQKEGLRGLILDLRLNPGGRLDAAVDVCDLFLTEGRIVSTRGRNEQEQIYDAKESGTLLLPASDFPMAVLISRFSASASEIVAAALQDHKRAVIVGERSYGKGSVQNVVPMEGDTSALKLTTASYWRPSGKNIHRFPDSKESDEWGVKPDPGFEVLLTDQERAGYLLYRRDRDIVHGKTPAQRPPSPPKPKKSTKKEDAKPFVDRVLQKAVEHLRGQIKKVDAAVLPELKNA